MTLIVGRFGAAFLPLFRRIGTASREEVASLRPGLKRAIVPANQGRRFCV